MADETTPAPASGDVPAKKPAARKPAAKAPTDASKPAAAKVPAAKAPAAKAPAAAKAPVVKAPAAKAPAAAAPKTPAKAPAAKIPVAKAPATKAAAAAAAADSATPVPAATTPALAPADASAPPVATPAYAAPAEAPRKRRIWPWFVIGGAVVFIGIVVGLVFLLGAILGGIGGDPKQTVTNYDLSFKNADCELFKSTTTEDFQNNFFGSELDCETWADNAKALTVDGVYKYSVEIVESKTDGAAAEVLTKETDSSSGDSTEYDLRYYLIKDDGKWLIEGINTEGE